MYISEVPRGVLYPETHINGFQKKKALSDALIYIHTYLNAFLLGRLATSIECLGRDSESAGTQLGDPLMPDNTCLSSK